MAILLYNMHKYCYMTERINHDNELEKEKKLPKKKQKNLENTESIKQQEKKIVAEFTTELDEQDRLENEVLEDYENNEAPVLIESLNQIKRAGEQFVKNTSEKLVTIFNNNKLVISLRDSYVARRSKNTVKEITNEKRITKADDYDSYLKLVQSEFWGTSKNGAKAIKEVNEALEHIADNFPEKRDEVLNIWPKLFSYEKISDANSYNEPDKRIFSNYLSKLLSDREAVVDKNFFENCSSDFLALKLLECEGGDNNDDEIIRRIDSIIENYPDFKVFPCYDVKKLILDFSYRNPEKIISNSARADFIFKIWKANILNDSTLIKEKTYIIPIIAERIRNCDKNEVSQIIEIINFNIRVSNISADFVWLVDILPLEEGDIDKINFHWRHEDFCATKKKIIAGESIENELADRILEDSHSLYPTQEKVFLTNLIINYPNDSLGVSEKVVLQALKNMKGQNRRLDVNQLESFSLLMKQHNWTDDLRNEVFDMHSISFMHINAIIAGNRSAPAYKWLYNEPVLFKKLESEFIKKADKLDVRHYFYEVLDEKIHTENIDELLERYAKSNTDMGLEEFVNLFITKGIDRKHAKLFVSNMYHEDIAENIANYNLSDEDTKWVLETALKFGNVSGYIESLEPLLRMVENEEERNEILDSVSNNLLSKLDDIEDYEVESIVRQYGSYESVLNGLSLEDAIYLSRKLKKDALESGQKNKLALTEIIFKDIKDIERYFENEDERRDFVFKAFVKHIPSKQAIVMASFYKNNGFQELLGEELSKDLESQILQHYTLDFPRGMCILANDKMNESQKENFVNYFEENFKISSVLRKVENINTIQYKENPQTEIDIEKIRELLSYLRSKSDKSHTSKMLATILKDPDLDGNMVNYLGIETVLLKQELSKIFLERLHQWPEIDGTEVLYSASEYPHLKGLIDSDEVKKISAINMKNRGISPAFWKGYIKSSKDEPSFYLDQEIFSEGIENIGQDFYKYF